MKTQSPTVVAAFGFLIISLLSIQAQEQDFNYSVADNSVTITGYAGPGGDVVIPEAIDGLPVTSIGEHVFKERHNLTGVIIPSSVVRIGRYAFFGCTGLMNVFIPSSVISIGEYAFYLCTSLTSVTIPSSVTEMGVSAFAFCSSLRAIHVDASNPSYKDVDGVLFNKTQDTLMQYPGGRSGSYVIPSNVISIGFDAFCGSLHLTSVAIPKRVTAIGTFAFAHCVSLTSVTIPENVISIGGAAFTGCTNMTNILVGEGVISIASGAFRTGGSLVAIEVDARNSSYSSIEGVLFDKTQDMLLQYPSGKPGSYAIPGSVKNIEEYAFYLCTGVTSVAIPKSVTNIERSAFSKCISLAAIHFDGVPPRHGNDVFQGTDNVIVYYLPGTTGWGPTFADRPTVPWLLPHPVILSHDPTFGKQDSGFGFTVSWATIVPVVVEVSTDPSTSTWFPIQTLTLTNGSAYYTDLDWTNHRNSFYRVRSR